MMVRGKFLAAENRKRIFKRGASFGLFFIVLFFTTDAFGWWNDQWQHRRKVSFDTSPAGADVKETQSEMPLLIRLHTGNFNFGNVKANGEDIRFVGADDQTILKHHIEKYDTIDEMAVIWVKLPKLTGGGNQDFIWMYYGNEAASAGQAGRETYDGSQAVVYHFGEIEGKPQDMTANGNHPEEFLGGLGLPGVIGNGISFSGGADRLVIRNSPSLNFFNGFTFSAWIRINQDQQYAYLYSRASGDREVAVSIDGAYVYATLTTAVGYTVSTEKNAALTHGQWHLVAVTAAPNGQLTVYIDGAQVGAATIPGKFPVLDSDMAIGGATTGGHGFSGELDEVRIAGVARSADWLRACFASEGPDGRMCAFGAEEKGEKAGGGSSAFYNSTKTVLKNITLDGWIIIGLLAILSIITWLVFISKTVFLFLAEKDNRGFMKAYVEEADTEALLKAEDLYENSSLFHIFKAGARKLSDCLSNSASCMPANGLFSSVNSVTGDGVLRAGALNTIKSVLDKGFIEQSKRMNSQLVILTLSISGGPFLGLLGTVWGVMTTFAAMADAGEANIMAIAPGMASALATTVVGLIVAIPALFAYNYLTGKIKSMTADLTVFVDQFGAKIEEFYGEKR